LFQLSPEFFGKHSHLVITAPFNEKRESLVISLSLLFDNIDKELRQYGSRLRVAGA
jgi:hypothetical protein